MLIAYNQQPDGIETSYVTKDRKIDIKKITLKDGYYKYVETDEFDKNKLNNLRSFHDSPIKKIPAKFFSNHNINEFFSYDIPNIYPEHNNDLQRLIEPLPFSIDIETDITDKYGYSTQEKAENAIRSISITDSSMNTILFILKSKKQPDELDALQENYVEQVINDTLTEKFAGKYQYNFKIRYFDSEIEMLNVFLECINNFFHLIFGWNFVAFDWVYIMNRCKRIGVNVKKASPVHKLQKFNLKAKNKIMCKTQIPLHRIVLDYMVLFKNSLIYNNLGSYSLNSIAEDILGLKKVLYSGNLRSLYENEYEKFIAYAIVDTILVMLIHKHVNLLSIDFFQSHYTNVPYINLGQNAISEALVYKDLRSTNNFLLESEKTGNLKRSYIGGYVKLPTTKIVEAVLGVDYGALYPNAMITTGLSPEAYVDSIQVDELGYPINKQEEAKWLKYKAMNCCLVPNGRIYDVSKEFLYTRIEKGVLEQRYKFKAHKTDIYLNIKKKIQEEINKRKNYGK